MRSCRYTGHGTGAAGRRSKQACRERGPGGTRRLRNRSGSTGYCATIGTARSGAPSGSRSTSTRHVGRVAAKPRPIRQELAARTLRASRTQGRRSLRSAGKPTAPGAPSMNRIRCPRPACPRRCGAVSWSWVASTAGSATARKWAAPCSAGGGPGLDELRPVLRSKMAMHQLSLLADVGRRGASREGVDALAHRSPLKWTAHAVVGRHIPADAVAPPRPGRSGDQKLACPGLETQYDLSEDDG